MSLKMPSIILNWEGSMGHELQGDGFYTFGPFCLDAKRQVLMKEGHRVRVTAKALKVLQVLVERPGQLITKEDLMETVWGENAVDLARIIHVS